MGLYTFFLDFQGGTYLSQVRAKSFNDAPKVWAEEGNFADISKLLPDFKGILLASVDQENAIEIEGLINTWCLTFSIADELALVHFTETTE